MSPLFPLHDQTFQMDTELSGTIVDTAEKALCAESYIHERRNRQNGEFVCGLYNKYVK